ncbi:hypothetical protein [Longispora albida]|uniref:hypothetical protein n=1 Tax=Longispora albida TaxID=203523 RepID=UPI00039E1D7D|nr:hypothetical protein [Longispora albida]
MKQAELVVGDVYAFPTYKPYDDAPLVACVRVVSVDGNGKVTVRVVEPGAMPPKGAWGAQAVKRNEKLQVTTRSIVCPWDEWPVHAESIRAEQRAVQAKNAARRLEAEERHADRVLVDGARALPVRYRDELLDDHEYDGERDALAEAYITARKLGPYAKAEDVKGLLEDFPLLVARDIIAADPRDQGAPGTVGATFMRAARVLEAAQYPSETVLHPDDLLGESDVAFVEAVCGSIAAAGGEVVLPVVPPLPSWVDEEHRTVAGSLGWLRVAIGDTYSGQRVHAVGCRRVQSRPVSQADHKPWWLLMLESRDRLCGVCDGPGARDLKALASFVAAADVWRDREGGEIEPWQQVALLRLLAAASAARAVIAEPDITLATRITTALADNAPGELGWAAYALMRGAWGRRELQRFTPQEQESALALARDRLATAEASLPDSQRPIRLPQRADPDLVRQRYQNLKTLLEDTVPQLDRLLFTLPGAD